MTILVTGAAGFIGAAVVEKLLQANETVIGIDNINDYYDISLKHARLARLDDYEQFSFYQCDLSDKATIDALFAKHQPRQVINLAAQAGVRYSLENPMAYVDSNLVGFTVILEACRHHKVEHLVYASSSSVYGNQTEQPFTIEQRTDQPISLYAATKKSNELLAHAYSHLYELPVTGLRFFTVYGPWGRPDMAPMKFAKNIMAGQPIQIYNHGKHRRDFTYIDDIVDGTIKALHVMDGDCHGLRPRNDAQSQPRHCEGKARGNLPNKTTDNLYRLYNIGCGRPVELMRFIELLEQNLGREAVKEYLGPQPGDVEETFADVSALTADTGYQPTTPLEQGIEHFAKWYLSYYYN